MINPIQRVAAIHDLSGFGRCSLSVIAPVLSVMEVQCVAIPTAVLSTHTGGFSDIAMKDLSDYLSPTLKQYLEISIDFNCIYTGFLASEQQIQYCIDFIESFPNALAVVDPVMGDHGKVYRTYTPKMCSEMRTLVKASDLITPNVTVMYLLLGKEYEEKPLTHQEARSMLLRLSELGPKKVIVTGVELADMTVNNIGYDSESSQFWRVKCNYLPVSYPGTGDIFTSVVVGSVLKGDSLPIAMERATRFLELAIRKTFSYHTDTRFGVMLENSLSWLSQQQQFDQFTLL